MSTSQTILPDDHPQQSAGDEQDPIAPADTEGPEAEEADPDEAVHAQRDTPTEANKQQDGDDAVHRSYKPAPDPTHENDERDPDDLVHGR